MLDFLVHGKEDNVAVAVVNVKAGAMARCLNMATEEERDIKALMDIPLGHKVALCDLAEGDAIIKYAHDIGRVVEPINKGQHVHVHNVKTRKW